MSLAASKARSARGSSLWRLGATSCLPTSRCSVGCSISSMFLPQPYATRKSSRNLKHHSTSEKCSKEVVAVETSLATIGATTWSRSGAEGTMIRVASLLVAFSLLFSDAPVCAEGAWVVWRTSKGTWEPIRVWATAAYVLDSFALLSYLGGAAGV